MIGQCDWISDDEDPDEGYWCCALKSGHDGPHENGFCRQREKWRQVASVSSTEARPIPMRLPCPACGDLHIDEGEFATKPHHTHACQKCGNVWRPAIVATVGVRFLPGFKNEESPARCGVEGCRLPPDHDGLHAFGNNIP